MKIRTKVILTDNQNESFMGIGVMWLLERIDQLGSILAAANDMHMSYAKAIRMIKSLEKNLGKDIVVSRIGGRRGGGSYLTPFAYKFLRQYRQLEGSIKKLSQKKFHQFLKGIK